MGITEISGGKPVYRSESIWKLRDKKAKDQAVFVNDIGYEVVVRRETLVNSREKAPIYTLYTRGRDGGHFVKLGSAGKLNDELRDHNLPPIRHLRTASNRIR